MKLLDRVKGSLIGGASGDSLGYTVEFSSYEGIISRYGSEGITKYELINNVSIISDDTQMTLFTAGGLLVGEVNEAKSIDDYNKYIYKSYLDWYYTQTLLNERPNVSWLSELHDLYKQRAPGLTCLSSLGSGVMGQIDAPVNKSKGCGGVMRVAPIAFYGFKRDWSARECALLAAKASAITHGHSLGYIPSYTLVYILYLLCSDLDLEEAIKLAIEKTIEEYKEDKYINYYVDLLNKAIELSKNGSSDNDNIKALGEGWVGEETLAIALYASLRYSNNFKKALVASVNHSGDSDSTGSVTGNILGCYLGILNIDLEFKENLELFDAIIDICNDLVSEEINQEKYPYIFEL